jgi:hypothetical protein
VIAMRALRFDRPRGRIAGGTWLICADEPHYGVLVNAAVSAYTTGSSIAFYAEDISAESPVHGLRLPG